MGRHRDVCGRALAGARGVEVRSRALVRRIVTIAGLCCQFVLEDRAFVLVWGWLLDLGLYDGLEAVKSAPRVVDERGGMLDSVWTVNERCKQEIHHASIAVP